MDRNEVMQLIVEAGWRGIYTQWTDPTTRESIPVPVTIEQIERAFELVAKREREECAKAVKALLDSHCEGSDECHPGDNECDFVIAWEDAIEVIRARGEKK